MKRWYHFLTRVLSGMYPQIKINSLFHIFINKSITMNVKSLLDQYLSKDTRITERDAGNGYKEVCDLDTGDCYTVSMRDGLIERVDNTRQVNRTLKVETPHGVKTLLNG
jgi:hypothetical protein